MYSATTNSAAAQPWMGGRKRHGRVLIVEDDPAVGEMIRPWLEKEGQVVGVVTGPEQGLADALAHPPDVILMDVMMPGIDGFSLAQSLQRDERTRSVPIIFLSARGGTDNVVHGLDLGAVDYVVKPFSLPELVSRVKVALRLKTTQDELRQVNSELAALVLVDSLTGLHNRRALMERLQQSIASSIRHGDPLSCLMLDLDHFKEVNDIYGHQQGDTVLRELAGVLRRAVRTVDTVGRYGGEEFAVICPSTDLPAALRLAERIRAAVEVRQVTDPAGRLPITVSVGCAVFDAAEMAGAEDLLARADAALYRAKRAGRNCVRSA